MTARHVGRERLRFEELQRVGADAWTSPPADSQACAEMAASSWVDSGDLLLPTGEFEHGREQQGHRRNLPDPEKKRPLQELDAGCRDFLPDGAQSIVERHLLVTKCGPQGIVQSRNLLCQPPLESLGCNTQ